MPLRRGRPARRLARARVLHERAGRGQVRAGSGTPAPNSSRRAGGAGLVSREVTPHRVPRSLACADHATASPAIAQAVAQAVGRRRQPTKTPPRRARDWLLLVGGWRGSALILPALPIPFSLSLPALFLPLYFFPSSLFRDINDPRPFISRQTFRYVRCLLPSVRWGANRHQ